MQGVARDYSVGLPEATNPQGKDESTVRTWGIKGTQGLSESRCNGCRNLLEQTVGFYSGTEGSKLLKTEVPFWSRYNWVCLRHFGAYIVAPHLWKLLFSVWGQGSVLDMGFRHKCFFAG